MVGHIVNGNQFLPTLGDDASDVFLQFVIMLGPDEVLAAFNSKDDMDINLRIGIGHVQKRPPSAEFGNLFCADRSRLRRLGHIKL